MFKTSFTMIATAAVLAAVSYTNTAHAGGCNRGGSSYGAYQSKPSASYQANLRAKKAAQARAAAAAKRKKQITIAKARAAEKARAQAVAAKSVNKSTKTVAESAVTNTEDVTVASVDSTCSKFIAMTGTTVEVECETQ